MDKNSISIDDMPLEVLEQIFSFLNFHEKLTVSEVCWHWFNITVKEIVKRTKIAIEDQLLLANNVMLHETVSCYSNCMRTYQKITYEKINFNKSDDDFKQGLKNQLFLMESHLEYIEFKYCDLSFDLLVDLLKNQRNLSTLALIKCEMEYRFDERNLELLPNLKELIVDDFGSECDYNENMNIIKRLLRDNRAKLNLCCHPFNLGDDEVKYIPELADKIKILSLDLGNRLLNNNLFAYKQLDLEELTILRPLPEISDDIYVECLSETQRNLKKLHLTTTITFTTFVLICKNLPFLETLHVKIVEDEIIPAERVTIKRLQALQLCFEPEEKLDCFLNCLNFVNLNELLISTPKIVPAALDELFQKFPKLKKLTLLASMRSSDLKMQEIGKKLPALEEFAVRSHGHTSLVHFAESSSDFENLRVLKISLCPAIADSAWKHFVFPNLLELGFYNNVSINGPKLATLFKNCPGIKRLTFSQCDNLEDADIEYTTLLLNYLEYFKFTVTQKMTKRVLTYVLENCNYLQKLEVDGDTGRGFGKEEIYRALSSLKALRKLFGTKRYLFDYAPDLDLSKSFNKSSASYSYHERYEDSSNEEDDEEIYNRIRQKYKDLLEQEANAAEAEAEEEDDVVMLEPQEDPILVISDSDE